MEKESDKMLFLSIVRKSLLNLKVSKKELLAMLDKLDADKDGSISVKELLGAIKTYFM